MSEGVKYTNGNWVGGIYGKHIRQSEDGLITYVGYNSRLFLIAYGVEMTLSKLGPYRTIGTNNLSLQLNLDELKLSKNKQ